MAKYGAKYLQFAPLAATNPEPPDALPNYGAPISLGKLVKVTDAPAFNEGKQYGDNEFAEHLNEFKECPIDVEVTELSNPVASVVLGAAIETEGGDIAFADGDNAPYGGLGFLVNKQIDGKPKFQGVFYPKAKAVMQGDEFASKGDSITLTGGKLKLTAAAAKNKKWKIMSDDLATEAEAKTWVDEKLKAAVAG